MLNRLMGVMIAITVALASSSVAFAQNGKQGPQKAKAGRPRTSLLTRMIYLDSGTSPTSDCHPAP